MKLFIDSANIQEIKDASDMGVICGVTTNPSLAAKEGRDFIEMISEIAEFQGGPVSAEVISEDCEGMIREAKEFKQKIASDNLVIKIPMTAEGLRAVNRLSKMNIRTNVTLIFSPAQALLASRAGASYVSPFVGRLDDIGFDGGKVIKDIKAIFSAHNIKTEIIAASIRNPIHVTEAAKSGADIATVPYGVILQMLKHPLTDAGIERFLSDWRKIYG